MTVPAGRARRDPDDLLLPAGARLVHIGPQKTGTTSVQAAMHRRREELLAHGVVYPGRGTRPRGQVYALIGTPDGSPAPPRRKWDRFVAEVEAAGDRRVCVSTEDLGRIELDLARQVVTDLGGPRVHVVAAARQLDSLLPSQWQQRVRMRRTAVTFDEWLRIVLGPDRDHPEARNFWMPHDVGALVARWTEAVGSPDRFTLVISDRSHPDQLPRTFEAMLGLPSGFLDLPQGEVRNQSLGIGRTEVIRQVTAAVERHEWPLPPTHAVIVRLTNALKSAAPWPGEAPLPRVPDWAAQQVAELGDQRAAAVRDAGARVVGDPDALRSSPPAPGADGTGPAEPVMVSADLAATALEQVLAYALEQEAAARTARRRARRLRRRLDDEAGTGGWTRRTLRRSRR